MKIGILTLPLHTNYGGILQAYALQLVLKRMGHDALLIDNVRWELRLPLYRFTYWKYLIRSIHTRAFIMKNIDSVKMIDLNNLDSLKLDAIIVGSDQVWRPMYFGDIKNAYLYFAKSWKIKRIAYAASFGTDNLEYTPEQTRLCANLIKSFDAVSVREDSAIYLCNRYFNIKPEVVLDPTMLLDPNDYLCLVHSKKKMTKNVNHLCMYFLDKQQDKYALAQTIVKENAFTSIIELGSQTDDLSMPLIKRIQPPVESWLTGIYFSSFIVTDSFHGCVFSILFHKPFIVYGNKERGETRFKSLLKMFDLEDRLLFSSDELYQKKIRPINWDNVDICLAGLRMKAYKFLNQALK
jgi:hypothetical protein